MSIEAFIAVAGKAAFALARRQGGDRRASEASRQHARAQYAMIAPDERQWCEAEQKELEG